MSDSEQDGVPVSSPAPNEAPAQEPVPASVDSALPESNPVLSDAEVPASPVLLSEPPPPTEPNPPSSPSVSENSTPSVAPSTESSSATPAAPIYAALLSVRDRALEAIQFRRRARLEKIIALVEKKISIGNDDVEKLLHVSDSTATRYLSALVREGKLKQTGVPQAQRYSMPSGSNGAV